MNETKKRMNNIRSILAGIVVCACLANVQAKDYLITDYGAKPDGITLNSKAIQSAIDEAFNAGGGKVIVPAGVFYTATLELKSNVELHLQKGAMLLGSTNIYDYHRVQGDNALIIARGQENIVISGEGTIDGQGQELALNIDSLHHSGIMVQENYNYRRMRPGGRPNLLKINECKNVKITGITAVDATDWVLRFNKCDQLEIDNVTVDSDAYWNNDGIDIGDCKNVRITNCNVNAADDGICLKSEDLNSFCDQVYIANNVVRSSASAIKFGTASHGGFKNVTIENIKVYDTFRSALAFEAVDGGIIENVTANNITATNTGNAIFIKLGHRNVDGEIGAVRNIKISNVKVEIPFGAPDVNYKIRGPELPFFHNPFPSSISGLPGHNVENVTIENVEISYPGRANRGYAHIPLWRLHSVPEVEEKYPEFSMFGELPSWGFYVRHVDELELKNVKLTVREEDFRPAYVFDDVKNLKIEGGNITSPNKIVQVVVKDVTALEMKNVFVGGEKIKTIPSYGENSKIKGVELISQPEIAKKSTRL
ncbi:glycosyl hydrolase family 28 protein [Reichenbachiella sp. MALMAid0571]|uniref:glycoside hydrolase family 28 protein n=1 Tax=Reichenbachiella sp. MALMAid0571 TaxID=3143939 RepID=UPI0032DE3C2D